MVEFQTTHGVLLAIFDKGVLLTGTPGVGKSDCALQLLARGHQLIADDAPLLKPAGSHLIGSCPPSIQNLLAIRALGIVDVRVLFGEQAVIREKSLDLIIQLNNSKPSEEPPTLIVPQVEYRKILGRNVPYLTVNLALCQNAAILIESAVRWLFMSNILIDFQGSND